MQFYLNPEQEQNPLALPDAETFYIDGTLESRFDDNGYQWNLQKGWYWWACFPGCLPDGVPMGPFDTETLAIANAQEESRDT